MGNWFGGLALGSVFFVVYLIGHLVLFNHLDPLVNTVTGGDANVATSRARLRVIWDGFCAVGIVVSILYGIFGEPRGSRIKQEEVVYIG